DQKGLWARSASTPAIPSLAESNADRRLGVLVSHGAASGARDRRAPRADAAARPRLARALPPARTAARRRQRRAATEPARPVPHVPILRRNFRSGVLAGTPPAIAVQHHAGLAALRRLRDHRPWRVRRPARAYRDAHRGSVARNGGELESLHPFRP